MRDGFETYSGHFMNFNHAAALMVPLYRASVGLSGMLDGAATHEDRQLFQDFEYHSALLSVGLAIQNILLLAEELGIGACCLTGPLIAKNKLEKCFSIPVGWQIAALIMLGYADEVPKNPGRKPLNSFIRWL
jgi:nitroreductase